MCALSVLYLRVNSSRIYVCTIEHPIITDVWCDQQMVFKDLKVPPKIVGARNVPPPMAQPLENDNIPSVDRIVSEARKLLAY